MVFYGLWDFNYSKIALILIYISIFPVAKYCFFLNNTEEEGGKNK